jgi:inhibitor of cysteine peptidase
MPYNLVYTIAMDSKGTKWMGSVNFDEPGGLVAFHAEPVVDFNSDGTVDINDLVILIEHWGTGEPLCDIGPTAFGDGIVDVQDLTVFIEYFLGEMSPEEVNVNEDDDGTNIELEKGQILAATLESNPTTGYSWEVAENQETVLQQMGDSEFKPEDTSERSVGSGGCEIFRFKAISAGQITLKLVYRRPWEEGIEPVTTFSLNVAVK